ncbi:MAG: XrtA-associated tyrosine autokinase [Pseudomonadota bacterium]
MKKRRAQSERAADANTKAQGEELERDGSRLIDAAGESAHGLVEFAEETGEEMDAAAAPIAADEDEVLSPSGSSVEDTASGDGGRSQIQAGDARAPEGTRTPRRSNVPRLDLPIAALRESGLMPDERETRRIEDQYRRIKRPLLANAFGINVPRLENGNLIMVASSLPGEGKSFTSFNLAMSIAHELDRTVLLVDADVAKPHISRALQMQDQPGLIDLISDPTIDLQDVILPTSMDSMRFLPAGPIHRHSTELLASTRTAQLVEELGQRYPDRVIVFDTPPLIPTTEAQAMAHLMGQIVVVVHAGHTPQNAVMQALETIEGTGEISLVLNKTRTAWGDEYGSSYGYYGKYGYGSD